MTQAILLIVSAVIGLVLFELLFPANRWLWPIGVIIGAGVYLAIFVWLERRKS